MTDPVPAKSARRMGRRRLLLGVAVVAVVATAAAVAVPLAQRGDAEPTLLSPSDFEGVREVVDETAPGWYMCAGVIYVKLRGHKAATSMLRLSGHDAVGATVYESNPTNSSDDLLDDIRAQAAECEEWTADAVAGGWKTVEPLTDLDVGMVGWRVRYPQPGYDESVWGEVLAIPLDDTHLLRVGFETGNDEPPVSREELIRLALEGVERVGLDEERADD